MALEWIEDSERPGGIGRAERERVFWERVASGQRHIVSERGTRRKSRPSWRGDSGGAPYRVLSENDDSELDFESPWESARLALATILTVVVFGLGWVGLELENRASGSGASGANGYDWSQRDSAGGSALVVDARIVKSQVAQAGRANSR